MFFIMKFLVIGHTVEDHFGTKENEITKPGGIFYTAIALNSLVDKNDEFFLCTSIEQKNRHLFLPLYDELSSTYFQTVERIPKVFLTLHDFKERGETYENITKNLDIDISDFSRFTGILINMITGFDINLEQLINIRKNFSGIIYLDVHTLARGLDENMKREFRQIPEFKKWAECIDILQVNESELKVLTAKKIEKEIINEVLNFGVKILIVTRGKLGAHAYSLKNNKIISFFSNAIEVKGTNQIGCGDVFGATFFYTYIKDRNIEDSLRFANIAAGCVVSYLDLNKFNNLKNDVFKRFN